MRKDNVKDFMAGVHHEENQQKEDSRYVTTPSENFAEREGQAGDYHPDLCFKLGQTHRAYGWSRVRRGEWDDAQWNAYCRGHNEGAK